MPAKGVFTTANKATKLRLFGFKKRSYACLNAAKRTIETTAYNARMVNGRKVVLPKLDTQLKGNK